MNSHIQRIGVAPTREPVILPRPRAEPLASRRFGRCTAGGIDRAPDRLQATPSRRPQGYGVWWTRPKPVRTHWSGLERLESNCCCHESNRDNALWFASKTTSEPPPPRGAPHPAASARPQGGGADINRIKAPFNC